MNDYLGANGSPCGGMHTGAGQQQNSGMYNAGISQSSAYAQPALPSGMNSGINTAGLNAAGVSGSGTAIPAAGSTVLDSTQFLNGYLQTQIGKSVTVEFLFGTDTLSDRTGTLLAVGANYIVIREIGTQNQLVCDFFSIKIVRIYQST